MMLIFVLAIYFISAPFFVESSDVIAIGFLEVLLASSISVLGQILDFEGGCVCVWVGVVRWGV